MMYLSGKKIFLAGSAGLAGTAILRYMLDNAPDVKVRACYHNTEPIIKDAKIEYVQADLRSSEDCRRAAKGCDCAIMAAGYTGGADFVREFAWEHTSENLAMNMNMLDAFRLEKVKRVIFIGSSVIYQEFEGRISEDGLDLKKDPHEAYLGYGWAMRFIEKMCGFLHSRYGVEIILVRLANIFGPYAKFNPEHSNFIPAIVRKAVEKKDPFEVWGSPDVTRDALYADDFAKAVVMLLAKDKIKFDTFNIGSETETRVSDVVTWALKYAGHTSAVVKYIHDKPVTMRYRLLDCAKINNAVGWKPRYTVEEGIKKITEWWIKNRQTWRR